MTRSLRRFASLIALAALAFAQLAVSAYACPKGMEGSMQSHAALGEQAGVCPDVATANLCERHCDYGSSSVSTVPFTVPDLPVLAWSLAVLPADEPSLRAPARHLAQVPAPPSSARLTPLRI